MDALFDFKILLTSYLLDYLFKTFLIHVFAHINFIFSTTDNKNIGLIAFILKRKEFVTKLQI